jgi:hypothetical protein
LHFGFDHEGERVGRLSARARRERFWAEAVAASGVIGNAADANYRICRLGYFTNRRLVVHLRLYKRHCCPDSDPKPRPIGHAS